MTLAAAVKNHNFTSTYPIQTLFQQSVLTLFLMDNESASGHFQ